MATTTAPAPAGPRGELARAALTALLALGLLLPFVLRDGTPRAPRLTVFGGEDGLSLLLEGAGGGRVLLGGGGAQTEVGAQLGRRLRPWDRRLDLLLVADARDLPGAVDLVRHGDVRRVATLGLEGARTGGSASPPSATPAPRGASRWRRSTPPRASMSGERRTTHRARP